MGIENKFAQPLPPQNVEQKKGEPELERFNSLLNGYATIETLDESGNAQERNLVNDVTPLMTELLKRNHVQLKNGATQEDIAQAFLKSNIDITAPEYGYNQIAQEASRNISKPGEKPHIATNLSTGIREEITMNNFRNFDDSPRGRLMNARDIIVLAKTTIDAERLGIQNPMKHEPKSDAEFAALSTFMSARKGIWESKGTPEFLKNRIATEGKLFDTKTEKVSPQQEVATNEVPAKAASPEQIEKARYEARTPIKGVELWEQYMKARLAEAGPGNELETIKAIAPIAVRFNKLTQDFPDLSGARYNPMRGERIESPIDRMATFLNAGEERERKMNEARSGAAAQKAAESIPNKADQIAADNARSGQQLIDQYAAEIVGSASKENQNEAIQQAMETSQKLKEAMAKYPDVKSGLYNTKTGKPLTAVERAQMVLDRAKRRDEETSQATNTKEQQKNSILPKTQEEAIALADSLRADESATVLNNDPTKYIARVVRDNIAYRILRAKTGAVIIEATTPDGQKEKVSFAGKPENTNKQ